MAGRERNFGVEYATMIFRQEYQKRVRVKTAKRRRARVVLVDNDQIGELYRLLTFVNAKLLSEEQKKTWKQLDNLILHYEKLKMRLHRADAIIDDLEGEYVKGPNHSRQWLEWQNVKEGL
jgi:hypothetical protein